MVHRNHNRKTKKTYIIVATLARKKNVIYKKNDVIQFCIDEKTVKFIRKHKFEANVVFTKVEDYGFNTYWGMKDFKSFKIVETVETTFQNTFYF